jgi:hypothetical protein
MSLSAILLAAGSTTKADGKPTITPIVKDWIQNRRRLGFKPKLIKLLVRDSAKDMPRDIRKVTSIEDVSEGPAIDESGRYSDE